LWLDTLPTNTDHGCLTTIVEFPELIPSRQFVSSLGITVDFPSHGDEELNRDEQRIKQEVTQNITKVRLDLVNTAVVQAQLTSLKSTIEEISLARKELGSFIRTSFPIDKIMD
jgi:hypothetical protein